MKKTLSKPASAQKTTTDAQKVANKKRGQRVSSYPSAPDSFTAEEAQAVRDTEYEHAWAEWAASGSKEYQKAVALGYPGAHIEHSSAVPQFNHEDDEKSPLDFASIDPEEIVEEEEMVLQEICEHLLPGFNKPRLLTQIGKGLLKVKKVWDKASASREADAILETLYLLGNCRSSEMRMKSYVLRSIIAREELSLADIAREYGVTRAAVSKTAVELKRFLRLQIHTSTRNEAFSEQCKERATRVHKLTQNDRERAKAA